MFAQTANFFGLPAERDAYGDRCAWALRLIFIGPSKAKRIAKRFGVSKSTAKLWLAGKLPTSEHLMEMDRVLGPTFTLVVTGRATIDAQLDYSGDALRARLAAQRNAHGVDRSQNTGAVSDPRELAPGHRSETGDVDQVEERDA